ncbi:MAG: FkbM family methyltransferase [Deltaproteobacteria bacterium]|nr:FkbM family methyltransferase [Deltaproteobacteria bacterium]
MKFIKRIFVRRSLYWFWRRLYCLALRGIGVLNYESPRLSGEEHFLKEYLGSLVERRPVVLDVGANDGSYVSLVRSIRPHAVVYAFEPHPDTYERLRKNVGDAGVTCFNFGFGDKEGSERLYDYANSDGTAHASLYSEVFKDIHKADAISHDVRLRTLDDFVREYGVKQIDLLKLDTEGNEFKILQGARRAIAYGVVRAIHFEFNEMNIVSGSTFKQFVDLLSDYSLYRMLPDGLVKLDYSPIDCEIYAYQNIVAVRNPGRSA